MSTNALYIPLFVPLMRWQSWLKHQM